MGPADPTPGEDVPGEALHAIEPRPRRDEEGRWLPRVKVVTRAPGGVLLERVLEPPPDVTFEQEDAAREHATRMALRWYADSLRDEPGPEPDP